ncbi:MAG: DUF4982 domain-containing protein [Bacteroidales bacterium]|nr:DUF4982 domain-containing protein [Bacteroidales bacterium]
MTVRKILFSIWLLAGAFALNAKDVRTSINLDKDWKFLRGDAEFAWQTGFDDSSWRRLDVPHDWGIEDDYDENSPVKRGGGYLGGGIGWYRKTFRLDGRLAGKRIYIEFGGVMANSDVWINEQLLGHRPIGYLPLYYDITDYVKWDGTDNVLAVRADNTEQPASRWYAGDGIYRHVFIHAMDPVHIDEGSVFVTTSRVSASEAQVQVESSFTNLSDSDRKMKVRTVFISPTGKKTRTAPESFTVRAGQQVSTRQTAKVRKPALWDIDSPNIYTAVTTLKSRGKVIDRRTDRFGIKTAEFRADSGFWLNGRNIKIKGTCLHNDAGALGTAVPASVWVRRMRLLKELGCNAIRSGHCPMDPAFYDACDQVGMLLFDETFDTWTAAKPNAQRAYNLYWKEWWAYDAEQQIRRVRNHPSLFIYSLGNEIRDNVNSPEGFATFKGLLDLTKRLDPTRPVTMALFRPFESGLYDNGFVENLDVVGTNYRESQLFQAWKDKPGRKIMGTENGHQRETWLLVRDNPSFSGQFLWTGFEYLGEADWPKIASSSGLFHRSGAWKSSGWQRRSWWTDDPMVRIFRPDDGPRTAFVQEMVEDYTPSDPGTSSLDLTVYSNCEEVELYRNGVSVGKQSVPEDDSPNVFTVDFVPGTIKAVGRIGGRDVAEHVLQTASAPVKLQLTAERASVPYDWEEVVYVRAEIEDANGVCQPNGNHRITLTVSGPGELVGIDNDDVFSHERYKSDWRTAYRGQVSGIIRATAGSGTITVTASAEGLEPSTVRIKVK